MWRIKKKVGSYHSILFQEIAKDFDRNFNDQVGSFKEQLQAQYPIHYTIILLYNKKYFSERQFSYNIIVCVIT